MFSSRRLRSTALIALAIASCAALSAQDRDRGKIPDRYKWNLAEIYPSDEAWRAAKEKLVSEIPKIREFKGKLASSTATLADALELVTRLKKEFSRLYVYASMMSDQDTRVSSYQGMQQEMTQIGCEASAPRRRSSNRKF